MVASRSLKFTALCFLRHSQHEKTHYNILHMLGPLEIGFDLLSRLAIRSKKRPGELLALLDWTESFWRISHYASHVPRCVSLGLVHFFYLSNKNL